MIPTNDAVTWNGTRFGLVPALDDLAVSAVADDPFDETQLLDAPTDPSRFVVAHVLLTRISGVQYESVPTWNGLAVGLPATGETVIDPAQRTGLADRWRRWAGTDPRPDVLPV